MPFGTHKPRLCSILASNKHTFHSSSRRFHKFHRDAAVSTLPPPRIDYKSIIEKEDYHVANNRNRNIKRPNAIVLELSEKYSQRNALMSMVNEARKDQNRISDKVKNSRNDGERLAAVAEAKKIKEFLMMQEPILSRVDNELLQLGLKVPNITHPNSPIGPEENATVLSLHGPSRLPTSADRDHVKIASELYLVDFDASSTTTGSGWPFLKGAAVLLEQALVQYALSIAIKHGFTPISTPDVIKSDIARRCGFNPRDEVTKDNKGVNHFYHLADTSNDLVLAGTAEIPLAGSFAEKTFLEGELPARVVGVGKAFRSEAGSRGTESRGLYRVHQFTKVELFAVTEGGKSEQMMEELKRIQIEIFEGLGFPFRVLDMPTEELGHAAYRKYDMEAWMPGRGGWGEISSTSNCLDFQSRRLHIRYRPTTTSSSSGIQSTAESRIPFAHTLNGTAAAIPRLIVALLENGARLNDAGQTVALALPSTLKRFWLGGEALGPAVKIIWFDSHHSQATAAS